MGLIKFILVVGILGAGAAYLTKPSPADAEAVLRDEVMQAVAKRELGNGRGTAENLALAACKLRPNDCYDLLRSGLDVSFEDKTLFLRVDVAGFERQATCYGAFTTFFCPGGLKE